LPKLRFMMTFAVLMGRLTERVGHLEAEKRPVHGDEEYAIWKDGLPDGVEATDLGN